MITAKKEGVSLVMSHSHLFKRSNHSFKACKISDGVAYSPTYPFNLVFWLSFSSSTTDNRFLLEYPKPDAWARSCNSNLIILDLF